jgi:hypothetical protein
MLIRIKKLCEDIDAPHVELFISNGDFAAAQDSYISDQEFLEFGEALQAFPRNLQHEVIFENGSPAPNYSCYIRLKAFVYDGVGHAALEVKMESHGAVPYRASAHYYVLCEAAALNRLGQSLKLWVRSKAVEFEFLE